MGIGSFLKESIGNAFRDMASKPNVFDKMIYRAKMELWAAEKRFMRNLMALFIMLLSFGALALAAVFFLIEYLALTKTLAFLIIGIILLVAAIIVKV